MDKARFATHAHETSPTQLACNRRLARENDAFRPQWFLVKIYFLQILTLAAAICLKFFHGIWRLLGQPIICIKNFVCILGFFGVKQAKKWILTFSDFDFRAINFDDGGKLGGIWYYGTIAQGLLRICAKHHPSNSIHHRARASQPPQVGSTNPLNFDPSPFPDGAGPIANISRGCLGHLGLPPH